MAAAEGSATTASSCRRGVAGTPPSRRCGAGAGCGLGRLVRRLRRQAALCAARPAAPAPRLRGCQYDPLSYARNFDRAAPDDDDGDDGAAQLYYSYTFSSRFVLSSSSSAAAVAAAADPTSRTPVAIS